MHYLLAKKFFTTRMQYSVGWYNEPDYAVSYKPMAKSGLFNQIKHECHCKGWYCV